MAISADVEDKPFWNMPAPLWGSRYGSSQEGIKLPDVLVAQETADSDDIARSYLRIEQR